MINGLADIIIGKSKAWSHTGTAKVEFEELYIKFKDLSSYTISSYKIIKIYLKYFTCLLLFIKNFH